MAKKQPVKTKTGKTRMIDPLNKPGKPTLLDEELTLKIRRGVLKGESYVKIRKDLGINDSTWDIWVLKDFQGFRQSLVNWKKERLIKRATNNLEDILTLDDEGNAKLLKIKADISKFVAERLDKDNYSSKAEVEAKIISLSLSDLFDKAKGEENENL